MGRWGDGEMGEMGEICIKGNCHNMILAFYISILLRKIVFACIEIHP
ncbi:MULTISPECIES: hypothetical protein [unclassified Moorena]|nr:MULTISPECIES: hypothetical protein [unclassified Moorena]NEO13815.1 hypothetical protein [Moorena sp. SIO3E8]NEQ00707.1 hypothetical protein [Moorena sp. SIO3F7]